jgi:hypothetical protein
MRYINERTENLEYSRFRQFGREIGSGPAEAFCKTLIARLKGREIRWDRAHADGLMALALVRSSGL